MSGREQVVVPLASEVLPIRHVRSTILLSSLASLRERGLGDAYLAALPASLHPVVQQIVAGTWVDIAIALAHYAAVDALRLPVEVQVALGRSLGDKVRGTLLGTAVHGAQQVGVTPWTIIPHLQRFWNRGIDGGTLGAWRLGPKEARIECRGAVLLDSTYFREALRGTAMSVFDLFCSKSYMRERAEARDASSVSYRLQWA